MIKFNKYHVLDTETKIKAPVSYSVDNRIDQRKCVKLEAKNYSRELRKIFPVEYINNSDSMVDYFEHGRVWLYEDHPLYEAARARAEKEDIYLKIN